jgi:hypothetical protein
LQRVAGKPTVAQLLLGDTALRHVASQPVAEAVLQQTVSALHTTFTHGEFARQVADFALVDTAQMSPQPAPASGAAQEPSEQTPEQH